MKCVALKPSRMIDQSYSARQELTGVVETPYLLLYYTSTVPLEPFVVVSSYFRGCRQSPTILPLLCPPLARTAVHIPRRVPLACNIWYFGSIQYFSRQKARKGFSGNITYFQEQTCAFLLGLGIAADSPK